MAIFDLDHFHEILQTLRRNRLRTFLTACGVFWGVFMLVVMLGFGRGLEKAVEEDFGFFAINTLGFSGRDDQQALRRAPGRAAGLARPRRRRGGASRCRAWRWPWAATSCFGGRIGRRGGEKTLAADAHRRLPRGAGSPSAAWSAAGPLPQRHATCKERAQGGGDRHPGGGGAVRRPTRIPSGRAIKVGHHDLPGGGRARHRPAGRGGPRAISSTAGSSCPAPTFARVFGIGEPDRRACPCWSTRAGPSADVEQRASRPAQGTPPHRPRRRARHQRLQPGQEFSKLTNLFFAIRALTWFVGVLTLLAGAIGVSNIMMIAVAERTARDRHPQGHRRHPGVHHGPDRHRVDGADRRWPATWGWWRGWGCWSWRPASWRRCRAGPGPRFFRQPRSWTWARRVLAARWCSTVAGALAGLAPPGPRSPSDPWRRWPTSESSGSPQ